MKSKKNAFYSSFCIMILLDKILLGKNEAFSRFRQMNKVSDVTQVHRADTCLNPPVPSTTYGNSPHFALIP